MKVIKEGTGPKTWTKEYDCTGKGNGDWGCGATLEITADDLFYTYHHDYTGDTTTYTTFKCPICDCLTDIDHMDVPDKFRNLIHNDQKTWKAKKIETMDQRSSAK